MRRVLCVLLALWLLLPLIARAEELAAPAQDASEGRVNRALLIGCDRFLSQPETTPSSFNNVHRMAEALSGSALALETLMLQPEGLSSTGDLAGMVLDASACCAAPDLRGLPAGAARSSHDRGRQEVHHHHSG